MTIKLKKDTFNEAIAEQAASWVVLMDEAELAPKQNQKFAHWLKQSPLHISEFLNACVLFDAVGHIDKYKELLITLDDENIAELTMFDRNHRSQSASETLTNVKHQSWYSVAAALLLIVFGIVFSFQGADDTTELVMHDDYSTQTGEQRSVVLDDGSIVFLNTQTRISVEFNDTYRNLFLKNGEATFQVAHDAERPFRVWADKTMIQAIGTEFNVRDDVSKTKVTVINGKVAVLVGSDDFADVAANKQLESSSLQWLDKAIVIVKGEGASVSHKDYKATRFAADLKKTTSWRERTLIFSGDPLSEVVQEFNRYNTLQISINDRALGETPISAIFSANSPKSLIDFLVLSEKAKVTRTGPNALLLSPVVL